MVFARTYPAGAEIVENGTQFRGWAPNAKRVTLNITTKSEQLKIEMTPEQEGYSACFVPNVNSGALYQFQLDDDETLYPDPASRYQPLGPHGSEIIGISCGQTITGQALLLRIT